MGGVGVFRKSIDPDPANWSVKVRPVRSRVSRLLITTAVIFAGGLAFGARDRLALRHVSLDLPGPPSKVIPVDHPPGAI